MQEDTEKTARRIGTVLRMIAYYQLDKATEQKMLAETAQQLTSLSREEMAAVLTHLDAASKAPNAATADDQERKAYLKSREALAKLKTLVNKFDLIRTLDIAAMHLEKVAKTENELRLSGETVAQAIRDRLPRAQAADPSMISRNKPTARRT